jgi:hypothetical protein
VLEERFLALVLNAQLPRPEVNAMRRGSAETPYSMMGFRTLRFTWRQVVYEPRFVAAAIAAAMAG